MFCGNCGKQIPDKAKFCRYCGASQAMVSDRTAAGSPAHQNGAQQTGYIYALQPQFQPAPPSYPQPVQQPAMQACPQPVQAAAGSAFLFSQKCSYKVAPESELKKYEWGGIPEGTVDIYEDRLEFFKKSKVVALAFGAIGSALSGKGKPDIIVPGHLVLRDTVENKKNEFRFRLTDGRVVYVVFAAFSVQQDACNAMFRFLNT